MATYPARLSGFWKRASHTQILCVMLATVITLQATLIPRLAINWDEFFFYHEVWQFAQDGTLDRAIQTLHVRVFAWITWLPGNAADHIIVARSVMFLFELGTIGAIYALARKFGTHNSALLCALAYVSFGFVFSHGFSFRTDPMAAAFLSGALALFAWKRLSVMWILAISCLVALAFLTTIKSVLWAPAFAGIAWLRWSEADCSLRFAGRLVAIALTVVLAGSTFYWLHSLTLDPQHLTQTGASGKGAAQKMFSIGIQPYWRFIPKAVALGIVTTLMMLAAPFNWRGLPSPKWIALASLWMPLTTFLFYHNTAAYYYAFILPPVIAAAAPVAGKILEKYNPWLISLAMACAVPPLLVAPDPAAKANQYLVINTAGKMFEQPVAYFDYAYMLPGFDKKNGFMTPWGIESYLIAQRPIYSQAMQNGPVPLVLENHAAWTKLLRTDEPSGEFLANDAAAIRETYIHAWGVFWLAGLELDPSNSVQWNVRVPGCYQIQQGVAEIDGRRFDHGAEVKLERGSIKVSNAGKIPLRIIWNKGVTLPRQPMAEGPIWMDF
ncbi:hypothetical protein GCM10023115_22560 [Pontixanthobacter gangjinensis]|uniref:Glycosyltransferase RgtA/B/C/D-like domain-containing protein n=1 Tax=Pontixanthobacter gangjinensis TaxID=1028742 RepID=A0A6I4SPC9_9SPHN|nr:hypothetical protein [Pontixanthobacter gangjinensis]MXO57499.1 hypothetical protein [Pontixanthobacter gangjinensis]